MSDPFQMYLVSVRVRPLPWHPKYYDWQFGILSLWLFADSCEDAKERSEPIVAVLPYERIGSEARVDLGVTPPGHELYAMQEGARRAALQTGLAIRIAACVTGTDEAGFENTPLD